MGPSTHTRWLFGSSKRTSPSTLWSPRLPLPQEMANFITLTGTLTAPRKTGGGREESKGRTFGCTATIQLDSCGATGFLWEGKAGRWGLHSRAGSFSLLLACLLPALVTALCCCRPHMRLSGKLLSHCAHLPRHIFHTDFLEFLFRYVILTRWVSLCALKPRVSIALQRLHLPPSFSQ